MADGETDKSGARDLEIRIAEIIERGGMTPEERLKSVLITIDCAQLRAENAARTGVAKGSSAWSDLILKQQAILANIEARNTDAKKDTTINVFFKPAETEQNDSGYSIELREPVGPEEAVPEAATVPVD